MLLDPKMLNIAEDPQNRLLTLRFCLGLRLRSLDSNIRRFDPYIAPALTGGSELGSTPIILTDGDKKILTGLSLEVERMLNIKQGAKIDISACNIGGDWAPYNWSAK